MGAHAPGKFAKPAELDKALPAAGLAPESAVGMAYSLLSDRLRLSDDASVNCLMAAVKAG